MIQSNLKIFNENSGVMKATEIQTVNLFICRIYAILRNLYKTTAELCVTDFLNLSFI